MQIDRSHEVRVPAWTWGFVALCAAVPVVALGGLIPSVIGGVGATLCYAINHDTGGKRTIRQRVVLCSVVSLLAWAAFGGLAWAVLSHAHAARTKGGAKSASSGGSYRVVRENGKVVYDSRLPSPAKRALAGRPTEERQKIYAVATRGWDALDEKYDELDARKAEGALTLRLESEIDRLERKQQKHLAYVRDRFGLSEADLDTLLDEGP